jgi:hypothetical protein
MAKIYRLQLTTESVQQIQSDDSVITDILILESEQEKVDFINDPEKFSRKVGLYTEDMKFNGLQLPDELTINDLKNDTSLIKREWPHEASCQLHMGF